MTTTYQVAVSLAVVAQTPELAGGRLCGKGVGNVYVKRIMNHTAFSSSPSSGQFLFRWPVLPHWWHALSAAGAAAPPPPRPLPAATAPPPRPRPATADIVLRRSVELWSTWRCDNKKQRGVPKKFPLANRPTPVREAQDQIPVAFAQPDDTEEEDNSFMHYYSPAHHVNHT